MVNAEIFHPDHIIAPLLKLPNRILKMPRAPEGEKDRA